MYKEQENREVSANFNKSFKYFIKKTEEKYSQMRIS
jgi:nucleosome binding factor SPN SPT16 subunit